MLNYTSFATSGAIGALAVLKGTDVNFVYSTPATAAIPALTTQVMRKTPFVAQIQDLWPQTVTASGFVDESQGRYLERILHTFCDKVYGRATSIAVTSSSMIDLIAERGIPRAKLHFVPNWAEEASFRPVPRDPQLAADLGLNRSFTVMYAGNLGEMQNLEHLVSAAERVRDLTDLQIAFVGSGVMESSLRATVDEKELDNVRFVPPQPFSQMSQILALGDAQVVTLKDVPLYRSTLPSKLQANLAAGRPIIGAVAGDAARVISQSGAGRTAPPGDADLLAHAIRELHAMPQAERNALGGAARNHYLHNFSEQLIADRLEELLVAAAQRRGK
ncbi:glycosyltransferase involved in cell wall biosynthesis [Janibacter cremeus]|uniref:D-inositol 3-phosphate glycosyltransferase n=2 Tax=Janibacter cremeus TaxID=1285192 RepID=A0A852VSU2_9MICO|nr:glycosyltransferase involved in cell wall biosynthesis [Janibacter cremeus]